MSIILETKEKSPKIHPTAIIHPNAVIGENVEIEAYAIIGENVHIDDGTWIGHHAVIKQNTKIGKSNKIFQFASIGEIPQDKKFKGEYTSLEIGDNNIIREFCTLNLGTETGGGITKIGNSNLIMAYVHFAHDCQIGNNCIFSNNTALAGHVVVKDWVVCGGYSIVHQFCLISEHVMLAAGSGVTQDVPPYVMAFGNRAEPRGINLVGLRRRGFTDLQIESIKHAYKVLYRNGLSLSEAKAYIADLAESKPELKVFLSFFQNSTRGIIR